MQNTQCIESVKCDDNEFDFGMRMHMRRSENGCQEHNIKSGYEFPIQTQ